MTDAGRSGSATDGSIVRLIPGGINTGIICFRVPLELLRGLERIFVGVMRFHIGNILTSCLRASKIAMNMGRTYRLFRSTSGLPVNQIVAADLGWVSYPGVDVQIAVPREFC